MAVYSMRPVILDCGVNEMDRRQLITGLISLVAAPAIVRAGSLMPVKVMDDTEYAQIVINKILTKLVLNSNYGKFINRPMLQYFENGEIKTNFIAYEDLYV